VKDNLATTTIRDNDISSCTTGIKTHDNDDPYTEIYNNEVYSNIYGIRLAEFSEPDIHDNDIYDNATGLYLEQSQPSRIEWNNFGWSGSLNVNADKGILVNYLQSGNTFLDDQWNNFYDGVATVDIKNLTGVTLAATGNYWYSESTTGPVDVSSPESSHNDDAGPGGDPVQASRELVELLNAEQTSARLPEAVGLAQNYPNSFNPSTVIRFNLPEQAAVTLTIHDVLGRTVRTLILERTFAAGSHRLEWNGADDAGNALASGVYFYRLQARVSDGGAVFSRTRKLVYVQ